MADVTLYSTGWCPFCVRAKRLLAGKDARVHEIDVDREPEARREMMADADVARSRLGDLSRCHARLFLFAVVTVAA